jgi:hypothetical protein
MHPNLKSIPKMHRPKRIFQKRKRDLCKKRLQERFVFPSPKNILMLQVKRRGRVLVKINLIPSIILSQKFIKIIQIQSRKGEHIRGRQKRRYSRKTDFSQLQLRPILMQSQKSRPMKILKFKEEKIFHSTKRYKFRNNWRILLDSATSKRKMPKMRKNGRKLKILCMNFRA